jgi:NADH-quinone oxidoreductase subunit M
MDLMLGNSSVMHMGYIFLAIAAFIAIEDNKLAIPAATLLMFAHGVSIAMSFSLADLIERKTKTLEFNQLGGLAKTAPKICFFFGLVGMASIGLPGLANFAGEVMVFFSGFQDWDTSQGLGAIQWATIIALWGVVISAVYMLRAIKNTFHGDLSPTGEGVTDIALREQIPALMLGATLILVGFFPKILLQFLN